MSLGVAIKVLFEIVAVLLVAFGFLYEDKVVAFENRMLHRLIRRYEASKKAGRRAQNKTGRKTRAARTAQPSGLDRFMKQTESLSFAEKENRANEAAFARNQAAAQRALDAKTEVERCLEAFEARSRHVA